MNILTAKNYQELLDYVPQIKSSLKDWVFVSVRLADASEKNFTILEAAELIQAAFGHREGKVYIGNDRELLLLLHWQSGARPEDMAREVGSRLPEGRCEVKAYESTPQGFARFELLIICGTPVILPELRKGRRHKLVMVADDDMYVRLLVRKGVGGVVAVCEIAHGEEVVAAYKERAPDVLFLDIHLPGIEGMRLLGEILALDPKAYIVMLSADSSLENVQLALRGGAKGFLTKPFTKEKLLEHIEKASLPG
jgi:two-component system chemotaxis response regulator CheY